MNIDTKSWLKALDDTLSITALTIPGSHNSCARYFMPYGQCQTMTLKDQLYKGLRFFDIRCRHINNSFNIHHDLYYLKANFNDVLKTCLDFLQEYPSEFIILSIKEEYKAKANSQTFEDTLRAYIKPHEDKFFLENRLPSLGEARGKIIPLSRYENTLGLDASNWDDLSENNNKNNIVVQDKYLIPLFKKDKWQAVKSLLLRADKNPHDNKLYLNFASGTNFTYFQMSKLVAKHTNLALYKHIKDKNKARYGILILDFPELPYKDLADKIINLNF